MLQISHCTRSTRLLPIIDLICGLVIRLFPQSPTQLDQTEIPLISTLKHLKHLPSCRGVWQNPFDFNHQTPKTPQTPDLRHVMRGKTRMIGAIIHNIYVSPPRDTYIPHTEVFALYTYFFRCLRCFGCLSIDFVAIFPNTSRKREVFEVFEPSWAIPPR